MKKKIYPIFLLIAVVLFFSACIKDTDFDQTEEIEISPTIELDFLFFNLHSQSFTENGISNLVISDTTNFDFLNDDFDAIQKLIDQEKAEEYPADAFDPKLKDDLQTDLDTLDKIKSW